MLASQSIDSDRARARRVRLSSRRPLGPIMTEILLIFAITLQVAVLLSDLANRSVLSTAVLFLLTGFVVGGGGLGLVAVDRESEILSTFVELALFSVLFTDGMHAGFGELRSAWRLPGRALLLGMPLTLVATALLARWVVGLPWVESFLIGAALSPTDPVFAAAIVGREEIPLRVRRLLNVESGLNDGLALPLVMIFLAVAAVGAHEDLGEVLGLMVGEVVLGVVLGVVVPWVAIWLEEREFLAAARLYEPLHAFSIGLLVLALAKVLHANEFLAAFSAGVTIASIAPRFRHSFHQFGELLAELLKLAALLLLGIVISPDLLTSITGSGLLFAILALVLARPLALLVALWGGGLDRREWITAAWFGPKGFASVFFSLLILQSGIPHADHLVRLLALVIVASIVAHSSTDVLMARWYEKQEVPGEAPSAEVPPAEAEPTAPDSPAD